MITIIFDLDGTLVNTIGGIAAACNNVLTRYSYQKHSVTAYKGFVGNGLAKTLHNALPTDVNIPLDSEQMLTYVTDLLDVYSSQPLVETQVYEGISELLVELKKKGIKWGIHTNKQDYIAAKIIGELFQENDYIGFVGASKEVKYKPHIDGTLQLIGTDYNKDDVIFVGDSEVDYYTAKNLGVRSVLVSWGFRDKAQLLKLNPDIIIDKPEELLRYIERITND